MSQLIDDLDVQLVALAEAAPTTVSMEATRRGITRRRRRRNTLRVAGGALCLAGLVGGLVALNASRRDVIDEPAAIDRGSAFVGDTEPPYVLLPLEDWTITYFDDAEWGEARVVVVDELKGFAGSSYVVLPASAGPQMGEGRDLTAEGIDGRITPTDNLSFRWIEWQVGDTQLSAHARNLSEADVLAITRAISVADDGSLGVAGVPNGLELLPTTDTGNVFRNVEYQWANADGRTLQLTLVPGGNIDVQIGDRDTSYNPVTIDGHEAFVSINSDEVAWVDGFWVWRVMGEGFENSEQFLTAVQALTTTDRGAWEGSLEGHVVLPSERSAKVVEILADIPVPSGLDVHAIISADRAKDHYQLVAEVTAAVWCTWAQRWDDALAAGDEATAATAATAIASSAKWQALQDIVEEGDWPEVMWEYSDRVADGDRTVIEAAEGGLGCNRW